jgi:hypothetical protein
MIFEEMISIASSFITGLDHHEALIDLIFIAESAQTVTAGRDFERTEKLLEVLAAVEIEPTQRFDALATSVIKHRDQITSCLLVLNGWDEVRMEFVKKLRKYGMLCVPMIVGNSEPPNSVPGYWINSNHVARDLMCLPSQLSGT